MSNRGRGPLRAGRVILSVLVGLMMLWIGLVDYGDPTPAAARWVIGLLASAGVAWFVWWASGRR